MVGRVHVSQYGGLAQVPRLEPSSQLQPCGEEKYVSGVQEEELPEVF